MEIGKPIWRLVLHSESRSSGRKVRWEAGQAVLQLQECLDSKVSPETEETVTEFIADESWGKWGFTSSDLSSAQGGAETLYHSSDKSAAMTTLRKRLFEWQAHGYRVIKATTSESLEMLAIAQKSNAIAVRKPAARPAHDIEVHKYGFGCLSHGNQPESDSTWRWAERWKSNLEFDYRGLQKQMEYKPQSSLTAIAAHPTRNLVAFGTLMGEVIVLDCADGTASQLAAPGDYGGGEGEFLQLSYNADGRYLAGLGNGLHVWNTESHKLAHYQPGDIIQTLYSNMRFVQRAGRELLCVLRMNTVQTLDPSDWSVVEEQQTPNRAFGFPLLAPDGVRVFVLPKRSWSIEEFPFVWNLAAGNVEWQFFSSELGDKGTHNVCFHPSGRLFALGEWGRVTIWSLPEGTLVSDLRFDRDAMAQGMAFSPDGRYLAVGLAVTEVSDPDGDTDVDFTYACTVWDWEWGAQLVRLAGYGEIVAFSADGARLAIADSEKGIQVWGMPKKKQPPSQRTFRVSWDEPPDYDNQGRPYGHPNYGDDW